MNVRFFPYEYSGPPRKVAADWDVASTDIAAANIGTVFPPTK